LSERIRTRTTRPGSSPRPAREVTAPQEMPFPCRPDRPGGPLVTRALVVGGQSLERGRAHLGITGEPADPLAGRQGVRGPDPAVPQSFQVQIAIGGPGRNRIDQRADPYVAQDEAPARSDAGVQPETRGREPGEIRGGRRSAQFGVVERDDVSRLHGEQIHGTGRDEPIRGEEATAHRHDARVDLAHLRPVEHDGVRQFRLPETDSAGRTESIGDQRPGRQQPRRVERPLLTGADRGLRQDDVALDPAARQGHRSNHVPVRRPYRSLHLVTLATAKFLRGGPRPILVRLPYPGLVQHEVAAYPGAGGEEGVHLGAGQLDRSDGRAREDQPTGNRATRQIQVTSQSKVREIQRTDVADIADPKGVQ